MVFKVGETVVYPHHGAALIEAIETRTIKGEERVTLQIMGDGPLGSIIVDANGAGDVRGERQRDPALRRLRTSPSR